MPPFITPTTATVRLRYAIHYHEGASPTPTLDVEAGPNSLKRNRTRLKQWERELQENYETLSEHSPGEYRFATKISGAPQRFRYHVEPTSESGVLAIVLESNASQTDVTPPRDEPAPVAVDLTWDREPRPAPPTSAESLASQHARLFARFLARLFEEAAPLDHHQAVQRVVRDVEELAQSNALDVFLLAAQGYLMLAKRSRQGTSRDLDYAAASLVLDEFAAMRCDQLAPEPPEESDALLYQGETQRLMDVVRSLKLG